MLTQDENTTKLHTAKNGEIWYSKGIAAPKNSAQSVDTFLLSPTANGLGLTFRVLGVADNAELITSLYLRYNKGEVRSLQVAGPNMLSHPSVLNNPFMTMTQLRSIVATGPCGGWHHVSVYDYPTYALVARSRRKQATFDATAETYLHLHPAFRALSFIPTLVEEQVAVVLASIIDPRWYLASCSVDAVKKIGLYCGLTPKTQQKVSDKKKFISRGRELRCSAVLNSWKSVDPSKLDMEAPENFLYRAWRHHGGGWLGDLRASQIFLRYLVDNWFAGLDKRTGTKDGLFIPSRFFRTTSEQNAFAKHMNSQK